MSQIQTYQLIVYDATLLAFIFTFFQMIGQKDTEKMLDSFKAVLLTYAKKIKTRPQRYILAPRGTEHVTITDCYKLHQIAKKQRAFMFTPDGIQQQKFILLGGINLQDSLSGKALADKWRSTPERLKSLMNDKILFHYVVDKVEVYKKRNGHRSIQLQGKMDFYQLDRPFDEQFEIYKEIIQQQDKQKNKIINLDDENDHLKIEDRQQLEKRHQSQYKQPLKKLFVLKRQQLLEQKKVKTKTQVVKQYPKQKFRQYRSKDANGQIVFLENAPKPRKVYKKKIDSDLDEDGQIVVSDHQVDPKHGTVKKKKKVKVAIVQNQNQYDFYKMDSYDQNQRRPRKKSGPKPRKPQDEQIEKARQRRRRLFANEDGFYQGQTFNIQNSINQSQNYSSSTSSNSSHSNKNKNKSRKKEYKKQIYKQKKNRSYKKKKNIKQLDKQQLQRSYLPNVQEDKNTELQYTYDNKKQKKEINNKNQWMPTKFLSFNEVLPKFKLQTSKAYVYETIQYIN